jgi:PAS domain S-box-containing protein
MMRLHIHAKLLVAFTIVLLPALGLLIAGTLAELRQTQESILEAQAMTARAVATRAAEHFDGAIGFAWAVAQDPLLQSLDPAVLDPHLRKMAERSPLYDSIAVYDATGANRGWGDRNLPAEPRVSIRERRYFQQVMAANTPVISEVVELRRPARTGLVASVPIRSPEGRPIGVVNIMLRSDQLAYQFLDARLQQSQAVFLADSSGRMAFHTGASHLPYRQSADLMHLAPLQAALAGIPIQVDSFENPFQGDEHMGALAPVPGYPWVVGVSLPRDVALAPVAHKLRYRLAAFSGMLLLSLLLSLWLARSYARPVQQLQGATRALGRGERGRRVHIRTGDELEELGTAFNEMTVQISQREEEVHALRLESERRARELAAIITSVPDAILLACKNGWLVDANPAGLRLLGIEEASQLDAPLAEYLQRHELRHPDGRPMKQEELPIFRALAGETFSDVELRLRSRDGNELLLSANGAPVRDALGQIIMGELVIRDITRRRQEEEALQRSQESLAQAQARMLARELVLSRIGQALVSEVELTRLAEVFIAQSLPALRADAFGLWLLDSERQEFTLLSSHGLTEPTLAHFRSMDFQARSLPARAARTEQIHSIEDLLAEDEPLCSHRFAMQEGLRGLVAVPLRTRERLVGVMAYFTRAPWDCSTQDLEFHATLGRLFAVAIEKAQLFQQLREALRLREEFMSAAAHELKTPVTVIQTWSEILLNLEMSTERQRKGLDAIIRSSRRVARTVEHLFAAVKLSPGPPKLEREPLDLHLLVRDRAEKTARATKRAIEIKAANSLIIDADRQLMGEVVVHLLENAIQYTPPEGTVEITLLVQGSQAVVSIRDQGPGIPMERQPHVFEPLYEPLPPGAQGYTGVVGMGLHLSRQIIEAHGGRIWLESRPGLGSTFSFSAPLAAAASSLDYSSSARS